MLLSFLVYVLDFIQLFHSSLFLSLFSASLTTTLVLFSETVLCIGYLSLPRISAEAEKGYI